ncbi:MAG TPA: heme-binding protein [Burkholderiales bacterium]|nr:heme-binding protein [Burkholderiales bacterium]
MLENTPHYNEASAGRPMYVTPSRRLTLAGARKMMDTATALAEQAGYAVSVAIVDAGGHPILVQRMDGGRFHTVHSSTTKAVCAASNRRPTTARGAAGQALDTLHALGLALAAGPERWTAMEGGYPIIFEGECVGGIGVSGATWELDDRFAREAVEAIGASWQADKNG